MEISAESVERLVADLVAIDSVNPTLVPGGAGEAEVMTYTAAWLADAGLDVDVVDAAPGRPSVIGTARGRGGGRSLMLNGHLDTVGVDGMREPHVPHVRDGRLHGRGGYDMKGGVAACMLAAAAAARAELAGDVVVCAVADEEHSSIGMQAVLEQVRADACVVAEPTSLDVVVAHKGFASWEVSASGRAAHGSQPHLGVDAIAAVGPVLVAVGALERSLAGRRHELLGRGSVHASLIAGGQELSTYPERCVLSIERRTLPGEDAAQLDAELARARGGAARPRAGGARSQRLDGCGVHQRSRHPDCRVRARRRRRPRDRGVGRPRQRARLRGGAAGDGDGVLRVTSVGDRAALCKYSPPM